MLLFIQNLMHHYGSYVLGIALMLELLALPLPGEFLMTYTGLVTYQGDLNWFGCIVIAGLGTSIGMTASYWIGYKLGYPFFEKYGSKIHFGPERLHKTSQWFERYGNKLLIIAYFIPGVRHVTGYFSGITRMPFRTYMLFAYTGAFIWTGTFISLGRLIGPDWERYHHAITKYLIIAGIIAKVIFIIVYVYRKYKFRLYDAIVLWVKRGIETFHTLGRVRLAVAAAFGAFLVLFILMMGLIEDFLANEFTQFDDVASYIVFAALDESWAGVMVPFAYFASFPVLLLLTVLSLLGIIFIGKDRGLEAVFLFVVLLGGELWDEALRRLFHRVAPGNNLYTFPNEQTFITIIFLGFAVYLLIRHVSLAWIRTLAFLVAAAVCFLVGISRVYLDIQAPSDIVAGYVFGGVWLSLSIVLLEIFRIIRGSRLNLYIR